MSNLVQNVLKIKYTHRAASQKGNSVGVVALLCVVPATIFDRREPSCGVRQQEREPEYGSGTMGKKQKKSGEDR